LALALGIQHPDYLELTSQQLNDWLAYYEVEPFGLHVQNLQIGRVMSLIANALTKTGTKEYKATDFTIGFEHIATKKQSPKEIKQNIEKMFGNRLAKKRPAGISAKTYLRRINAPERMRRKRGRKSNVRNT
jgi:hypothetical protein